ncbi:MAG: hypothetical protein AB7E46_11945 [Desulfovibrio sp.]|jgi:hypothetical protein
MPAALVAQFPWWSLSDPVITFALRLERLGLCPRLVGPRQLDFIARRFPGEEIFRRLPVLWSEAAHEVPALLAQALSGPGPRFAVFFDEKSFLAGAQAAADLGARTYFYSTEIPDPGQFDAAALARAFRASRARLVIQDADRLRGYALATGFAPADPVLLPNASLPDADVPDASVSGGDYGLEPVDIPGISAAEGDWSRTLVLSGSIQAEHATLETVEAFLRCAGASRPGWRLLVSGWGGAVLDELRGLIRGRDEVVLNTDFLSGAQIRWVYSRCRAGVVSYFNGGYNHRHCGLASGKLFWICRAGKPVLSNDNLSIQGLVEREGLGFSLMRADSLDALDAEGEAMGARARAFFEREAAGMASTLDRMFAADAADKNDEGSA